MDEEQGFTETETRIKRTLENAKIDEFGAGLKIYIVVFGRFEMVLQKNQQVSVIPQQLPQVSFGRGHMLTLQCHSQRPQITALQGCLPSPSVMKGC